MNVIEIPVNQITPYDKNARYNDNAVSKVAESIKQFGFKNPIIIDKNKVIIAKSPKTTKDSFFKAKNESQNEFHPLFAKLIYLLCSPP